MESAPWPASSLRSSHCRRWPCRQMLYLSIWPSLLMRDALSTRPQGCCRSAALQAAERLGLQRSAPRRHCLLAGLSWSCGQSAFAALRAVHSRNSLMATAGAVALLLLLISTRIVETMKEQCLQKFWLQAASQLLWNYFWSLGCQE
jgi:hypothetical protein